MALGDDLWVSLINEACNALTLHRLLDEALPLGVFMKLLTRQVSCF